MESVEEPPLTVAGVFGALGRVVVPAVAQPVAAITSANSSERFILHDDGRRGAAKVMALSFPLSGNHKAHTLTRR